MRHSLYFRLGLYPKTDAARLRDCAYVAKPFTPDAILALLQEVVGRGGASRTGQGALERNGGNRA